LESTLVQALPQHDRLFPLVKKLFRLGLPGGFQFFFEVAAFSGAAVIIGWLGKYPLAAHQVAINLASVTYMMASGFSAAGAIRVGEAVGMGSRQRVLQAGTVALAMSGGFMALCCLIFLSINQELVALYINDPRVASIASSLVIIAGFFQLSDGIQVVGLGILRGIADVNIPTVITLFAYWIIGLPVGYLLGFSLGMNVQGIWIGLLIGLTVSAILLTVRFYRLSTSLSFSSRSEASVAN
jgi:multidrug resistance protein, MATE family